MKYQAIFHVHHSIVPLFDSDNNRLKKNIRKYVAFLKYNDITVADFTWHSHLYSDNHKLPDTEISYLRQNLHPLEMYKLVKAEAGKEGITVIPTLEVTCIIDNDKNKQAHFLVMHENAEMIFASELMHARYFPIERFFDHVPEDALVVIAHPWRFGNGLAYFMGADAANRIIADYGALAEYNAWIYPWRYLSDRLARFLPLLKKWPLFENFRLLAHKNFDLTDLKGFMPFYGMDIHARHLLPGRFGRIELEIDGPATPRSVITGLRQGRATFAAPEKIDFFHGLAWAARELATAVVDEVIPEILINRREARAASGVSRKLPARKLLSMAAIEAENDDDRDHRL